MQKFIIAPQRVRAGETVTIQGQDAVHMSRVLRLAPGDPVSMTDGSGMDYQGEVVKVTARAVEVAIVASAPSRTESFLDLTICSAMLKDKKMDGIIRELTQIGIRRWAPFFSERSVARPDPKKLVNRHERWQSIADESLKQCRRSRQVEIAMPKTFEAVMALAADADLSIAFWEASGKPLQELADAFPAPTGREQKVVVLIGPEGGFTTEEIAEAEAAGFVSCALGPRILRAETAALTAAVLVQYLLGDLGAAAATSP